MIVMIQNDPVKRSVVACPQITFKGGENSLIPVAFVFFAKMRERRGRKTERQTDRVCV